jgi:hypothetical protein
MITMNCSLTDCQEQPIHAYVVIFTDGPDTDKIDILHLCIAHSVTFHTQRDKLPATLIRNPIKVGE